MAGMLLLPHGWHVQRLQGSLSLGKNALNYLFWQIIAHAGKAGCAGGPCRHMQRACLRTKGPYRCLSEHLAGVKEVLLSREGLHQSIKNPFYDTAAGALQQSVCMQAKQDLLAAKQSMFSRHASTEKALKEHKEQLAAAKEELTSKEGLHQTMKANAANLRAQISSLKVHALLHACMPVQLAVLSAYMEPETTDDFFSLGVSLGSDTPQSVMASAGTPGWAGAG